MTSIGYWKEFPRSAIDFFYILKFNRDFAVDLSCTMERQIDKLN